VGEAAWDAFPFPVKSYGFEISGKIGDGDRDV